jgi:hypothetical protein
MTTFSPKEFPPTGLSPLWPAGDRMGDEMFKLLAVAAAFFVAGMLSLACSGSGLKRGARDAGTASGGQPGNTISSGTRGDTGGTIGSGGVGGGRTGGSIVGPGGAEGVSTGGAGGTIGPGGAGGSSLGDSGGLASNGTSPGSAGNTGGNSSGGQANTGGSAGPGGMSGSGGTNGTGGAVGSDSTQASIDASVPADVNPDVQVLPQCSLGDVFGGHVCSTGPGGQYSGKLIAAASIDTKGDPEFASCVSEFSVGSLQYSFTLALVDGGTTRIGYGSDSALMPLPSLAAWVGKSVNVDVHPYSSDCCSGGSSLTVADSASLVLAVNAKWWQGGSLASQTVGSSEITVAPDAPICVGWCNQLEGGFVFSGASAVSLAPGGVGSFKLGDMTFTAYAGLWSGRDSSRSVSCADPSNGSSWAVFRNGI